MSGQLSNHTASSLSPIVRCDPGVEPGAKPVERREPDSERQPVETSERREIEVLKIRSVSRRGEIGAHPKPEERADDDLAGKDGPGDRKTEPRASRGEEAFYDDREDEIEMLFDAKRPGHDNCGEHNPEVLEEKEELPWRRPGIAERSGDDSVGMGED